jgi:serpin B
MKKRQLAILLATMNSVAALFVPGANAAGADSPAAAAQAVNALGWELLTQGQGGKANALLSPYSIQSALAMTFAGAAGATRDEMARVLHYSNDEAELHRSFAALQQALAEVAKKTAERAENAKKYGGPSDPVTLTVANRLFGQQGYEFRQPFLALGRGNYGAPLQLMEFVNKAPAARLEINSWVEDQTRQRIRDLIPPDGIDRETRLVLVNAIYLKAPWAEEFSTNLTKLRPFHINGGATQDVPTMERQDRFGHAQRDGYCVVTIPYSGGDVQFLILLPDAVDGLAALEAKLTPHDLTTAATPGTADVKLQLPKFKLEPPLLRLSEALIGLGMKSAFDKPEGSANFDRMAPRKPDDYLKISEVFHKTFLELDEKGTEAAAATAVVMVRAASAVGKKAEPIEVRVDRPFLFALQHRPSGACLFLGRVTNPL